MKPSDNKFERISDKLAQAMEKRSEALVQAVGTGRPFGTVHLTKQQKIEYWHGLPPQRQAEMWQSWTPEEQDDFMKDIAPELGGGM